MTNKKTAIFAAVIAAGVSAILVQDEAISLAGSFLPMAAKEQDRLPGSTYELVKVDLSTASVVADHDPAKRLTVLTKSSN
jgi:hypothetical protein